VHSAWITAVVFTVCNAVLLTVRIRVESRALAALPVDTHATSQQVSP
jgi:methyltransferase